MKLLAPWPEPPRATGHVLGIVYLLFAVGFAVTVVIDAMVSEMIMLGPGLVDNGVSSSELLFGQLAAFAPGAGAALLLLVSAVLVWNGVILYRSYDRDEPGRTLTFLSMNAVSAALLLATLALFGAVSAASGGPFAHGFDIVHTMTRLSHRWLDTVPTLVDLPYPLPLFAALLCVDLFHYWFHRLGHTWRPFWLLWHRPHHLTPWLTIPTTQPVFVAVPLFLLLSIPFQLGVGVGAKLFHAETMLTEALLLRVLGQVVAIGSHTSATYELFAKNRGLRALGWFYGEGVYHYVHHSALEAHSLVNLGATPAQLWDRVFGTYAAPPEQRPPVGLTGQPALHSNPLRLALAGLLQLAYELRHNRGLGVKLNILFGSSQYTPPHSKDYVLAEDKAGAKRQLAA